MFSPLAFPAGSVLYDLSTAIPLSSHSALSPFELYREPLVVLGISDGHQCCVRAEAVTAPDQQQDPSLGNKNRFGEHGELQEGLEDIKDAYSKALVHRVFVFNHVKTVKPLPEDMVAVPSPEHSNITTMKTIMCDLTSQLLGEMTTLAKSIQALPTVQSPTTVSGRRTDLGSRSGNATPSAEIHASRSVSPTKRDLKSQHRMSMPVNLPSDSNFQSGTPESRARSPPSRSQTPVTTFDEIAGSQGPASPFQKPKGDSRQDSKDRLSMQGFGAGGSGERERMKGKGRVGIVIGTMYLLAGRWPDAIKELVESATISKANNDYVWIAKALDCILVALLMEAWAGMDFKVSFCNWSSTSS